MSQNTSDRVPFGILPFKEYRALLSQSGTAAPTAVVLADTLGITMTWARSSTGIYTLTAGSAVFAANKTDKSLGPPSTDNLFFTMVRTSTSIITIRQIDNDGARTDGFDEVSFRICINE